MGPTSCSFFPMSGAPRRLAAWGILMYARRRSQPWVLNDPKNDPYELHNPVDDPASGSVRPEMENRLQQWMQKIGDSWNLDWTVPVEDGASLYRYRTFYTVKEYLQWAKEHPNLQRERIEYWVK